MPVELPALALPSPTVDAAPSTAAINGHPIHPILVPMPIGLLVAAAVSDLVSISGGGSFWARASRWLLRGGIATGVTAAAAGAIDFLTVEQARRPEGWIHATGNTVVLALAATSLRLRADDAHVPFAAAVVSGSAAALLLLTGWMGGELVFTHRVGVTARRHGEIVGTSESAG